MVLSSNSARVQKFSSLPSTGYNSYHDGYPEYSHGYSDNYGYPEYHHGYSDSYDHYPSHGHSNHYTQCCPQVVSPLQFISLISFIGLGTYLLQQLIINNLMRRRKKRFLDNPIYEGIY